MQIPEQHEPKGWHSRGYIPHFNSPETIQHVVFRTADSLPSSLMDSLPVSAKERARNIDKILDQGLGKASLTTGRAGQIIEGALLHFDRARYRLLAWCIMPNHVHVVIEQSNGFGLGGVIHSWKRFSAREINRLNKDAGKFWATDYFDRFIRDEDHFAKTIGYVERNPVKAGLCITPEAWLLSSTSRRLK